MRLTQRFTAEYSIRAFLEKHPEATLARLREWARDPSEHVRRLVSEGTRPRLPWAPRLRAFQKDPRPVIELLELLKDDPSLYVRRSVANNLNDIGKDHPQLLAAIAKRWLRGASARASLDREACIAFGDQARRCRRARRAGIWRQGQMSRCAPCRIAPARARIGGQVSIAFELVNKSPKRQRVMADLVVHFVKARGTGAKTFKLKTLDLAPGAREIVSKKITLTQLTTRRHYPGVHRVEALLNGSARKLGAFELRAASR